MEIFDLIFLYKFFRLYFEKVWGSFWGGHSGHLGVGIFVKVWRKGGIGVKP
jgi:hypothetical protein